MIYQNLKPAIEEIVQYACNEDNGYTIRIHAWRK